MYRPTPLSIEHMMLLSHRMLAQVPGVPMMFSTLGGVSPLLLPTAHLCGPATGNLLPETGPGGFGTARMSAIGDNVSSRSSFQAIQLAHNGGGHPFQDQAMGRPRSGTWRPPRESNSSEASDADFCAAKPVGGRLHAVCDPRGQYLPPLFNGS
jgi:hypothetical protein